jgi:hypothetical protein
MLNGEATSAPLPGLVTITVANPDAVESKRIKVAQNNTFI